MIYEVEKQYTHLWEDVADFWMVSLRDSNQWQYRLIPGCMQVKWPATDLFVWNEVIFTWWSAVVKYCPSLDHVHYKLLIVILLHTKTQAFIQALYLFVLYDTQDYALNESSYIQNFMSSYGILHPT